MICFFFIGLLNAQGAWVMSNRTHPELKWKTFQTTNFNIHYHEEIQEIAIQGANMAEQMRSTLIQQVGLDTLPHGARCGAQTPQGRRRPGGRPGSWALRKASMSRFETLSTSCFRMANKLSRPNGYSDFFPYTTSRRYSSRSSVGTTRSFPA